MDKHESIAPLLENIRYFVKWTVISLAMGGIVGLIGSVFGRGVAFATRLWQDYHGTVFFMPVAGLLIVWLYRVFHEEKSKGTNQVLESISAHGQRFRGPGRGGVAAGWELGEFFRETAAF